MVHNFYGCGLWLFVFCVWFVFVWVLVVACDVRVTSSVFF
jgi:hypothetical protein